MLPPHSAIVLVMLLTMGLLDATYTAFKVPIAFALPFNLSPSSANCVIDEVAGGSSPRNAAAVSQRRLYISCICEALNTAFFILPAA